MVNKKTEVSGCVLLEKGTDSALSNEFLLSGGDEQEGWSSKWLLECPSQEIREYS